LIFEVNPKFYRPAEVHKLCGDCSLAEQEMGWVRKTGFEGLVKKMYENDYELLSK
jgi:GDPmannose 4,6-dehydratase